MNFDESEQIVHKNGLDLICCRRQRTCNPTIHSWGCFVDIKDVFISAFNSLGLCAIKDRIFLEYLRSVSLAFLHTLA